MKTPQKKEDHELFRAVPIEKKTGTVVEFEALVESHKPTSVGKGIRGRQCSFMVEPRK
jgi:hypothetical protein